MTEVKHHPDGFWAIVEIMGHNTYAGLVTEETLAGAAFLRVDVPATTGQERFSKLFSPQSIYSITPTCEDIARAMADKWAKRPLDLYDLPQEWRKKIQNLPGPAAAADPFDDAWDDH